MRFGTLGRSQVRDRWSKDFSIRGGRIEIHLSSDYELIFDYLDLDPYFEAESCRYKHTRRQR